MHLHYIQVVCLNFPAFWIWWLCSNGWGFCFLHSSVLHMYLTFHTFWSIIRFFWEGKAEGGLNLMILLKACVFTRAFV